ncbi:hypothetical protein Pmar_PMAR009064 [Perkinsus marinus ATCC 50983]|uniref:Uncharacterized protein n=1 Tax=Perkinsus marinus (strain ATCC 50983 / TXsc) TaxID=423536 RepID=C5LQ36_PERM5|nr:hypothetical protein Pmar_PMAR009064 [Perkinsus marinus ATCC 50983]EER01144.1 hypothetical protein Pmar_PMAR009064 [Perkinsus marinus ATCC 50983]|eukprot:XP_002768426.1 hypothetical protein Pmar_PMAR009064 [Perkinsus marinus ATCC 50983]
MWLGDEGSDDDGSEDMTGWEPRPKLFIKLKEPRLASIPRIGNLNRGNPSLHTPKVLEMHRHQPVRDIVTGLALVQQGRATLIPDTVKQALEEDGKTLSEAIATLPVDSLWSPVLAGALQKLAFTTNTQSASYRLPQTTMYILSFL